MSAGPQHAHDPHHEQFVAAIRARPAWVGRGGGAAAGRGATPGGQTGKPSSVPKVADIGVPHEFLETLADRELIAAFRAQFRTIAPSAPIAVPPPPAGATLDTARPDGLGFDVEIIAARRAVDIDDAAGARATPDAPAIAPSFVRLQAPRADHFIGRGSGDSLDLALSVLSALPEVPAIVSVGERHVAPFLDSLRAARIARSATIRLVVTPASPSQWTHDNAKAALTAGGAGEAAIITSAYPSRSDLPSELILDESRAIDALSEVVPRRRSPLLFQGGNILLVEEPPQPGAFPGEPTRRVLLVGEAELVRNLHSTPSIGAIEQDFQREFGADRVVALPNASFHIDYDVSVRLVDTRVVAFVNDQATGAALITLAAIEHMERRAAAPRQRSAGPAPTRAALHALREAVQSTDPSRIASHFGPLVSAHTGPIGQVRESFADLLAPGSGPPSSDPVARRSRWADAHRVLAAFDTLIAPSGADHGAPASNPILSFYRAINRQMDRRRAITQLIAACGWQIVSVPSISDADRSVNFINALHTARSALVPSVGGLFAAVDQRALNVWRSSVGASVEVIPIPSGESQLRQGAVRCSAQLL